MKAQISKIEKESSPSKDKHNFNQGHSNGKPGHRYSRNKQHRDGWKLYQLYRNVAPINPNQTYTWNSRTYYFCSNRTGGGCSNKWVTHKPSDYYKKV